MSTFSLYCSSEVVSLHAILCWSVYDNKLKIFLFSVAPNIEFGKEYFEGVSIKAGENIRLKVTIAGRPVPKVTWFRGDVELTKKMVDITTISGSSTLFIRDADRSHRGLYSVEAINHSGTKKESIKVEVFGMNNLYTLFSSFIHLTLKLLDLLHDPDR